MGPILRLGLNVSIIIIIMGYPEITKTYFLASKGCNTGGGGVDLYMESKITEKFIDLHMGKYSKWLQTTVKFTKIVAHHTKNYIYIYSQNCV